MSRPQRPFSRAAIWHPAVPDPADVRTLLAYFPPGVQRAAWAANRYLDVQLAVPQPGWPVVLLIAGKVVASADA